ncbi:transcriptional regulator swi6 [Arachnomyces sp. PD_36]|nr:transcriptional regulator swi6 [Arachnomyces sp. PD_36]
MASDTPHSSQPNPSMSFPRESIGPSNGLSSSQPHMGSFNAAQSVASTPAATPPPPRASQQSNVSYSFSNNTASQGSMGRNSSFGGGYDENNGPGATVQQQGNNPPQIYRAVYSNVSVYEMEVNGVAVMRRRSDSWLNATQILKVAGVVKARRTKTLEKEVAAGEHEKVQGGYGKYQGTWVNYQRGLELCRHYRVEELLRPLLEYDMGQDGVSAAGQGKMETPTKEQAMAAQRKRLYNGGDNNGMGQPPHGTFFQNISRTAASAVNAISKARFDSPASRGADARRSSSLKKPPQPMSSQESQNPGGSQQSFYSVGSDSGFGSNFQNSGRGSLPEHAVHGYDGVQERPRKRMRSSSNRDFSSFQSNSAPPNLSMQEPTPTEPSDSFYQQADEQPLMGDEHNGGVHATNGNDKFEKLKLIMTLFLDKRAKDFSNHPAFLQLSSQDFEIPLDEFHNSALHWAAMLARMPLVQALLDKGVSIFRLNAAGETALQKAVGTRNNLDYRSFPKLLHLLAPTIEIVDYNGRTVLHHIAMMAASGGGGHVSAKHYLESLLEFIVRHGGPSSRDQNVPNGANGSQKTEIIGLGKFMSEIVNLRDDQGDTALNLAGRARTVLVPQLLEVGADPHIPNHTGLRPADYGVGVDMVSGNLPSQPNGNGSDSFTSQLTKTRKDIFDTAMAHISAVISESLREMDSSLSSDLSKKQEEFDHWHTKIRESAKARQIEQKRLDEMKQKANERTELNRRIKNLECSSDDLLAGLKGHHGEHFDPSKELPVGDSDKDSAIVSDEFRVLFPDNFNPSHGFSEQQANYLAKLPSHEIVRNHLKSYRENNSEIMEEVESLKSKNVVLGQNYRRMVIACTGWSAEQVDEAAEGLTQCMKDLNENPLPEDEAIEILMKDRANWSSMATGILHVRGDKVVDGDGNAVILRGAAIGGWLNMENFITGYPGHESQHRAAMRKALGDEKYEYFFDKWLEYFFTEADAKFYAGLGLNCIRIPFNYRHFEDDMSPRVLKEEGFKHLDRAVELCAKHNLYTILDMHAVPGGQNPGWHSDNPTAYASFWDHKDHQDRTVWLWEHIAQRYKGNPWVAGYNPLNEPCDSEFVRLPAFYERLENVIRKIDPDHILWLDGNTFAAEWKGFEKVLPNSVYALHDYSTMGFPTGDRYKGTDEQKARLERQYVRKSQFMTDHGTPVWNGEFGPVYADPRQETDAATINQERYNLLGEQLRIYDKYQIHWSIWLYKDIGLQGMVHTSPDSKWNKTVQPSLNKKKRLQLDSWGKYPSAEVDAVMNPLIEWVDKVSPTAKLEYPTTWDTQRHLARRILQTFLAATFEDEFASQFKDMDKEELDELARSFHFDECVQREGLNEILRNHANLRS